MLLKIKFFSDSLTGYTIFIKKEENNMHDITKKLSMFLIPILIMTLLTACKDDAGADSASTVSSDTEIKKSPTG